jgi:hypothetical protein
MNEIAAAIAASVEGLYRLALRVLTRAGSLTVSNEKSRPPAPTGKRPPPAH